MLPLARLGKREQLVDGELDELRVDRIGRLPRLRTDDREQVVDVVADRSPLRGEATDLGELEAALTPELLLEKTRDRLIARLVGTGDGARTLDAQLVDVVAGDQVHDDLPLGGDRHDVGRPFAAERAAVADLDVRSTRGLLPGRRAEQDRVDRDVVERVVDEHAAVVGTKIHHVDATPLLEHLGEGALVEGLLVGHDLAEVGHALARLRAAQPAAVRQRLVYLRQLAEGSETAVDALLGEAADHLAVGIGQGVRRVLLLAHWDSSPLEQLRNDCYLRDTE